MYAFRLDYSDSARLAELAESAQYAVSAASSDFAANADLLDGFDSDDFAQISEPEDFPDFVLFASSSDTAQYALDADLLDGISSDGFADWGHIHPLPDTVPFALQCDTAQIALSFPGVMSVGAVIAWMKTLAGMSALPDNFVECNGQTLSDPSSPYDGTMIPDLNGVVGVQRFLRGATSSGGIGGSEQHRHSFGTEPDAAAAGNELNVTSNYTGYQLTLPSYYEVVWIIRVK